MYELAKGRGDTADVELLIGAVEQNHDYEPSPKVAKIQDADAFSFAWKCSKHGNCPAPVRISMRK